MKLKKQLKRILSSNLTQNTIYKIKKKDLLFLSQLLAKGYSIQQSLDIIGGYEYIKNELMKGYSINNYLNLESKQSFYKSLNFFLEISSLDQAIHSSIEYENNRKEIIHLFIKEVTYPIFTLIFAIGVFIFFHLFLYPQLISFISYNENTYSILNIVINIFIILILLFFILFIIYIFIKDKPIFYEIYSKYIGNIFLIKDIFTYDFAFHYYLLIKQGYTTKQVFDLLMNIKKNTIFNINMNIFINKCLNGIHFNKIIEEHPYFDYRFITFFKIGVYTQTIDDALNDYLMYQRNKLIKYMKRFTSVMTTFSYMMVALLIVSIYQMLLLPIEMIQNF